MIGANSNGRIRSADTTPQRSEAERARVLVPQLRGLVFVDRPGAVRKKVVGVDGVSVQAAPDAVINRDTDRGLKVTDGSRSVSFAKGTHLLPAVVDEFSAAAREIPIVFVTTETTTSPVFVVGLETSANSFVTAEGKWNARYVPAYLRRYPFILANTGMPESVVCIDGGYESQDDGQPLFAEDGANTPYFDAMIGTINAYFEAARRTERFVETLNEHDLLRAIDVEVVVPDGKGTHRHTYLAVDETRLAALSKRSFLALRDANYMPLIYAHLFSLAAFANLSDKVQGASSV